MLSRKEAYQVLGLKPGANKYEIERRYNVLAKSYRGQMDEQAQADIQKFTLAYDILTGRYVEPEPEDPRMDEVIFGKTRREWKTKWLYAKVPLLVTLIVIGIVASIVYSIVTKVDPEYVTQIYGTFAQTDTDQDLFAKFVEASGSYLESDQDILKYARVIDDDDISKSKVTLGAKITLEDVATKERTEYTLVSEKEEDIFENRISTISPVGSALIGHKKGQVVTVKTPMGVLEYKIVKIGRP